MATIQILEHIVYADGSTTPLTVALILDGCKVDWMDNSVSLTWDQMVDVDHLSSVFEDTTVRIFKVIVKTLGKIYAYKDIYEASK